MSKINKVDLKLENLAAEILLNVFSYLDYKDLICCSQVNKRLHEISNHDAHWKCQCKKYWLDEECHREKSWKENFRSWYRDMGRYIHCYAVIKSAWNIIVKFMNENCPVIYNSINKGISEEELDESENKINIKLPEDLRCSYRIHNGQRLTSPGLMGSMSIHSHYRSESLLDLDTAIAGFQNREGLKGCIPITFCLHSGLTQFLALNSSDGYTANTIFYPSQDTAVRHCRAVNAFITGRSFAEWIITYSNQLINNEFVVLHEQPYRFFQDSNCERVTENIHVSVATCFLPELSSVNPPNFFHTYRITMTMSADALQSETCQLETRHWIITDDNGKEEKVDGPGVVGEYPVMYPGATFSWVSCTNFNTTYGNMKGHFNMRNLCTGDRSEVHTPVFHLKCLPYVTSAEREFTKKQTSSVAV